ncbi:hypothetical protein Scep_012548 [Stephania cephalantha]|uniref:Uncharacterized protein n=1 Tax=Stephania cephalantha TaxID=152367 RepID=A0AAP0JHB6_9MAGN
MGSFSIKPSLPYLHFVSYPLSFDDLALFTHLCLQSFVSLTQPVGQDMNELGTVKSWMISLIEDLLKYVKDEETCEAS